MLMIFGMAIGCYPGADATPRPGSTGPECGDCPSAKVLTDPEPAPGEMVNPLFLSWRIHPEGTTTVRVTRETTGTEIREVTRLLEKGARTITLSVDSLRSVKAGVIDQSKRTLTLAFLVSKDRSSTGRTLDATSVTMEVLGKTFPSFQSESFGTDQNGNFVTRRWDSDTVPGLLIRLEKETTPLGGGPVHQSVTELVELNHPNWNGK